MEYPGYGIYTGETSETRILSDAETVFDYLVNSLGFENENILIMGRSLGSGPATYLARSKNAGCLILISAFTSIR